MYTSCSDLRSTRNIVKSIEKNWHFFKIWLRCAQMEFLNNFWCFEKLVVCIFMLCKKFVFLFANGQLPADYPSAASKFDGSASKLQEADNLLVADR